MATRNAVMEKRDNGMLVVTWEGIQENGGVFDVGVPVTVGAVEGLTVQGVGNFDTSFTVEIQGSNDGVTYYTLVDAIGNDIILTATELFFVIPVRPLFLRPQGAVLGAADASDVDVIMVGALTR